MTHDVLVGSLVVRKDGTGHPLYGTSFTPLIAEIMAVWNGNTAVISSVNESGTRSIGEVALEELYCVV